MKKVLRSGLPLLILLVPAALSGQKQTKPAPSSGKSASTLSAEDKEILKNRELLENLELLQNFEKIKYFNFLSEKKDTGSKAKPETRPAGKDNASKPIK